MLLVMPVGELGERGAHPCHLLPDIVDSHDDQRDALPGIALAKYADP